MSHGAHALVDAQPVEHLAQRLDGLARRRRPRSARAGRPSGRAARSRSRPALGEPRARRRGSAARSGSSCSSGYSCSPSCADDVLAVDRLRRVVEDVQHVLAAAERQRPRATAASRRRSPGPRRRRSRGTAARAARPRRRARRGSVSSHQSCGIGSGRAGEHAGLAPEVLAQLVERRDRRAARSPRATSSSLVGEHPRQRGVEADEQRPEALAREPPRLLGGEHRLAGPRAADDRRAAGRRAAGSGAGTAPRSAATTSASPPAISWRSIDRISNGSISVATSSSIAVSTGRARPGRAAPQRRTRGRRRPASSARPSSSSTNIDWSAMRSGVGVEPEQPESPRIVSRSTSGKRDGLAGDRLRGRPASRAARGAS